MFTVYMFNTDLELATENFCICKFKVWITLFTPQMVIAVNDSKINAPVLRPYFPPRGVYLLAKYLLHTGCMLSNRWKREVKRRFFSKFFTSGLILPVRISVVKKAFI